MRRPKAIDGLVFSCLALAFGMAGMAEARGEAPAPLTGIAMIERVTTAVDRALDYLAGKQHADGSWCSNNAVNGLALLSFLGAGHVPGRGPYRDVLTRGKQFVLASQGENGLLHARGAVHGSMYCHALATLALAEMYGMDPDPDLEQAVRKAVDLIVRAQSPSGGWRYTPVPGNQDLSVTVMQVVALRAANNAEIPVPARTIDKAADYVRSCAYAGGGFGYQAGGKPNPQMSAAGSLSLQLLGFYNDRRIPGALEYLSRIPIQWNGGGVGYFYYFQYYAIQAEYQAGGLHWNNWHPQVRELLLQKQNGDGSWDVPASSTRETSVAVVGPDRIYSTSMACLVLEIYNHYLPAYQR